MIGLLGGLIGLILGSLRMPALMRWLGQEPGRAIGTNLVVGIAVGAAGLVGHLPGGTDTETFTREMDSWLRGFSPTGADLLTDPRGRGKRVPSDNPALRTENRRSSLAP